MEEIFLEMMKTSNESYEKTTIYEDGKVEMEILKRGVLSKEEKMISFIKELKEQLLAAYDKMLITYQEEQDSTYRVSFNQHDFYSLDLYLDIHLMVKFNCFRKLSVFSKYEKEKEKLESEKQLEEAIQKLDSYEKEKREIDIASLGNDDVMETERNIISFQLEESDTFELGQSRFFSDTIDLPEDLEIPELLEFVGQINLKDVSPYDTKNLLPKEGMLYFFQNPYIPNHFYEFGKVIYSSNPALKRQKVKVSNQDMILNLSLKEIQNTVEKFSDRYVEYNGQLEYSPFKGSEYNKIYGFFNNCQLSEEKIKKISQKYTVLLQLGSDIYGEGVTTFLILEEDLKNRRFDNIIYDYNQS